MLPSGVRRSVALVASILASRAAYADDPHDLFGLGREPKPAAAPAPSCDVPHTFGCATVTDPLDDTSPYGLTSWLSASYLLRLPVADARHDAVASYALGASRDETGVAFAGATGLENRWSIDGAPTDSVRTGGGETRLPLTFLDGIAVSAGGFTARDRASTGGTIDAQLRRGGDHHTLEAHAWEGLTGAGRERPIASLSYFVRRLAVKAGPDASLSVVATGPLAPLSTLAGGKAWYALGVAPALAITELRWRAARLVDIDQDGTIDGLPDVLLEPIELTATNTTDWSIPAMARAGVDRGPHHLELTLVGHATETARFLANSTMQAGGTDRLDLVGDAIATWRGRWKTTRAKVQLAWHRSDHREAAHDPAAADLPQLLTAYVPTTLAEDPILAMKCNDGTYPNIPQCPVPFGYFASGGAGPLVDVVADRPTMTAEVAHQIDHNVLRAGATLEDARLVITSRFTGGVQQRSLFEGHLDELRYVDGACEEDPETPCAYAASSELRYRTRYTAAYVEDTFSPTRDIRVDGGVRWELMWVGPRLHFSNELAPRLGMSWDVLGKGRSRVWWSMGRTHAMLPAGLGTTVISRDATVHDTVITNVGHSRSTDAGSAYRVESGVEPMAQDEVTAGAELGLSKTFQLTAWAQGRWLRRGLETTQNGFDNPGRAGELPATRETEALAIAIATAPTATLTLRAGYLVGRTVGTFAGPYDPQLGITNYDTDAYDVGFTTPNELGRLPTDLGHRVFFEADRRSRVGAVDLSIATRLSLASGRPRNALARTDVGTVPLIPRGGVGRSPLLTQANVRVAARWREFDLTLDVFNAFDHDTSTNRDELYTTGEVRPIEGGSYTDLVFLKTVGGATPVRRNQYGLPTAFQSPIAASLGLHRAF